MRYTLTEIRQMASGDIQSKLSEANTFAARYAYMNPEASMRYMKNIARFEQVLTERAKKVGKSENNA